ncbi:DNA-3-methyladenine glycosylase I [Limosilactobacillus kribbianus]|uniref:DNA-3-methyladenine glycosylase I n=1 Tax=Limosilactobacillus kribbianus TaxID=2982695 RepID=UPI002264B9ED|nr:DNA-3-methyladenine glycosylase I [Limosilactobacillus kribbianus]
MAEKRPAWAQSSLAMQDYYDHYWGLPVHDDRFLFEMLSLELFQAGLSWKTIWLRRLAFEKAFADFQIDQVAQFTAVDAQRLQEDQAIIRNRRKIAAVINNARVVKQLQEAGQDFDSYVWQFVDGQSQRLILAPDESLPAQTDLSKRMAKQMKKDGFKFVGPTTVYSFMTAVGLVNARL